MFEQATRMKLRFTTPQGLISTEDLWDLPLTSTANRANLDTIAVGLYAELNSNRNISFVNSNSTGDTTLQIKFDIVKHIIDIRKAENLATAEARARKEKKQQILALINQKETETLAGKSLDDLRKMAEEL